MKKFLTVLFAVSTCFVFSCGDKKSDKKQSDVTPAQEMVNNGMK